MGFTDTNLRQACTQAGTKMYGNIEKSDPPLAPLMLYHIATNIVQADMPIHDNGASV